MWYLFCIFFSGVMIARMYATLVAIAIVVHSVNMTNVNHHWCNSLLLCTVVVEPIINYKIPYIIFRKAFTASFYEIEDIYDPFSLKFGSSMAVIRDLTLGILISGSHGNAEHAIKYFISHYADKSQRLWNLFLNMWGKKGLRH